MSTFIGFIEEIPGVCIDRFCKENLNSSVFFLSHCHQDHMMGLTYEFFNHLVETNKFFYCSYISKVFLKNFFPNLNTNLIKKHIKELSLDNPVIIKYRYENIDTSVTVSCISSGHCLGSIMFLFVFHNRRILYTGDFRINIEDFPKLKSLHYHNGTQLLPLNIDKVYLDTTFLNLDYKVFPNRLDSVKQLCVTTKDWIDKDSKNIVVLEISCNFGNEFIYIELSKFLNKKIHVQDIAFKVYKEIQTLNNYVTDIGESTRIHACINKINSIQNMFNVMCRPDVYHTNILTIVLSTIKWVKKDTSCIIEWDSIKKQTKNICYSTHASYSEIKSFILYFKPKQVFACVCNENPKKIYNLLQKILDKNKKRQINNKIDKINFSKYKTFTDNFDSNIFCDNINNF